MRYAVVLPMIVGCATTRTSADVQAAIDLKREESLEQFLEGRKPTGTPPQSLADLDRHDKNIWGLRRRVESDSSEQARRELRAAVEDGAKMLLAAQKRGWDSFGQYHGLAIEIGEALLVLDHGPEIARLRREKDHLVDLEEKMAEAERLRAGAEHEAESYRKRAREIEHEAEEQRSLREGEVLGEIRCDGYGYSRDCNGSFLFVVTKSLVAVQAILWNPGHYQKMFSFFEVGTLLPDIDSAAPLDEPGSPDKNLIERKARATGAVPYLTSIWELLGSGQGCASWFDIDIKTRFERTGGAMRQVTWEIEKFNYYRDSLCSYSGIRVSTVKIEADRSKWDPSGTTSIKIYLDLLWPEDVKRIGGDDVKSMLGNGARYIQQYLKEHAG